MRRLVQKHTAAPGITTENDHRHLRHLLLDVPDTEEGREKETASRLNTSNVSITSALVKYLVLEGLVTPREVVILTFYNAQKKEYFRALSKLEKELGLKQGEFDDCVETCDSFQGRERKCVILDFVVTYYSQHVKMGNVSNEGKVNVACTRARDFFFVVARADILRSRNIPDGRLEYGLELLKRDRSEDAGGHFCLEKACEGSVSAGKEHVIDILCLGAKEIVEHKQRRSRRGSGEICKCKDDNGIENKSM